MDPVHTKLKQIYIIRLHKHTYSKINKRKKGNKINSGFFFFGTSCNCDLSTSKDHTILNYQSKKADISYYHKAPFFFCDRDHRVRLFAFITPKEEKVC